VLTEEGLVALEKRLTGKDTGEAKPVKAVKAKIEKTTEEKPAPKKKSAAPKEEKAAAPKKKAVTGKGATNA
jgi:hypothetical protein